MSEIMRCSLWQTASLTALVVFAAAPAYAEELEAFTEPYRRVAIPAPEIGVIAEIMVEEGDVVSEKQSLAKLEDSVLQASLEVAKAAMDAMGSRRSAETEVAMREKQLESYRDLRERGNATQREVDRAESEYQQSLSRFQSVREDLEIRRLEYERVKAQIRQRMIRSPVEGFVIAIDKEVGEFVSPTDPVVMHVVHLAKLKCVFSVPLVAARDLRPGQSVNMLLGYERTACKGIIEFISPVADAESGTIRVKVRIPNRDYAIRSGVACRWECGFELPVSTTIPQESSGRPVR
jgi:RND family efflux transporter MFP subunit